MSLTDDERRELEELLPHYPDRRAAADSALRALQRRRRWLSDESLADLGEFLGMSVAELDSLATFANMLFRQPVGRHVVLLCDSFACWSLGYAELRAAVEAQLGVGMGEHHARRPLHAAADRLPRRLRPRPGDDGRRRPARPRRARRRRRDPGGVRVSAAGPNGSASAPARRTRPAGSGR